MLEPALRRTPRALVAAAVVVLVLFAVAMSLRRRPLVVDTAAATIGPLVVRVVTNGTVEPVHDLEVRARSRGRVAAVLDAGTHVEQGDILVRLDDTELRAQRAQAESDRLAAQLRLEQTRTTRELARRQLATDQYLYDQGAVTRERYQQSSARFAKASADLQAVTKQVARLVASLTLRIAQLSMQEQAAAVVAPFPGTVYRTHVKVGQVVEPGTVLLKFADLRNLRVRVNVDQTDLGRVRTGQPVRITSDAYPSRSWSGHVAELIPDVVVKESRSVSEALVPLEPPVGALVPGMTVDAEITVARRDSALLVPSVAIFSEQGRTVAYRVEHRRARRTLVTIGRSNATHVEVTDGLTAGDIIVLAPAAGLADGVRLTPRRQDTATDTAPAAS
ncbi:MAG: efflux RND transporter periplasmic adaptor subunit [Candidatus Binatia bacterium]